MSTSIARTPAPARTCTAHSSKERRLTQQLWRPAARQGKRTLRPCVCEAAKGFGKSNKQKNKRKPGENWIDVGSLSEFPADRPTKAVVLKDKSVVMLYNIDGEIFCSDANSTAYKYPLTHAKIVKGESGPAVEVPLDGTIYDLETGKVLEWCPKNNLIRKFLGAIKSNQRPQNLKVYPAQVDDNGNISVKFFTPSATVA